MTLSRSSLVERAWLLGQSRGIPAPLGRYDAMEPQARASLARKVAVTPMLRDNLRKDFSLTVAAGVAALASHLIVAEPLILSSLRFARITSADSTRPWQWLPDLATLSLSRPQYGLVHFAVDGQSLYVTDTDGVINTLTTTATAFASFIPLTATVSGNLELEELLITELVQWAAGGEVASVAT